MMKNQMAGLMQAAQKMQETVEPRSRRNLRAPRSKGSLAPVWSRS